MLIREVMMSDDVNFKVLKGLTLQTTKGIKKGEGEVVLATECGKGFRMFNGELERGHGLSAYVEDVVGDIADIIGSPILLAEEVSGGDDVQDSRGTWTFYKLSTIKGSVTLRWYVDGGGYYGEHVDFEEICITDYIQCYFNEEKARYLKRQAIINSGLERIEKEILAITNNEGNEAVLLNTYNKTSKEVEWLKDIDIDAFLNLKSKIKEKKDLHAKRPRLRLGF